jgi:uncharacterized membrane protein YccC
MPMTARLAQTLQEKLGSEGAAEMITWFDETQRGARAELRELNELNFSRFDARMGERMAVLEQKLDQRMATLDQKLSERIAGVEQRLGDQIAAVDGRLLRWMVGMWIVTLSAMGVLKMAG